jgi:hypothetical protein
MLAFVRTAAVLAALLAWTSACGDDGKSAPAQPPDDDDAAGVAAERQDAATALPPEIRYPATKEGLEQLARDLIEAVGADDPTPAEFLAASLQLPDHERWFTEAFGPRLGARLAAEYEPATGRLYQIIPLVAELAGRGQTTIVVERFTSARDRDAVGYQSLALQKMKESTPLFSLRFLDPKHEDRVFHLWSFVHDEGTFRWVGKMKQVADQPPADGEPDVNEIRMRDVPAATP